MAALEHLPRQVLPDWRHHCVTIRCTGRGTPCGSYGRCDSLTSTRLEQTAIGARDHRRSATDEEEESVWLDPMTSVLLGLHDESLKFDRNEAFEEFNKLGIGEVP